ncbi:MAG: putative hydrolase or acyltransferase [Ilumatobacteraceae bacterium]|nr:putative hydrolase or acyltransferase [Ilumatobacteraceae bacterium]
MTTTDLFPGFGAETIDGDGARIFCRVGGEGPPLLLIHGFPQTHMMWHRVAGPLAEHFTTVAIDLRGYGRSDAPPDDDAHTVYSKRAMGADLRTVMAHLGYERFRVVGHDRGARVAYRMAYDSPDIVDRVAVLDILPTAEYWDRLDHDFGIAIYHWMFLAQPPPFPERLISGDGRYFCDHSIASWTKDKSLDAFDPVALEDYRAMFDDPARIAAMCADYRAGAGVDLELDVADRGAGRRIAPPLIDIHGRIGLAPSNAHTDVWKRWASDASGVAIQSGHFVAEENPQATLDALLPFLLRP